MFNITLREVKDYLRVDFDNDDDFINSCIEVAKQYVLNYTGLSENETDGLSELRICILMIIAELYDNRSIVINDVNINPVYKMLLDIHCNNFM